ncbi:MAG: hypothetical protein VYB54_07545 [Pseudomonadota bacterium]|nr:hypothetical protein [Pseudomonadota bacterium]
MLEYDHYSPHRLSLSGAPSAVVSTADLKAFLRVDTSDDDDLIAAIGAAATAHLDGRNGVLGRALGTQTWVWSLDRFPGHVTGNIYADLRVPLPPLQSVTSISYVDPDGDSQTLSTDVYDVDTKSVPGVIFLKYGQSWPSIREQRNAVTVTFVAGYSTVPGPLVQAIKNLSALLYDQRSPVVTGTIATELPLGLRALIAPYMIHA